MLTDIIQSAILQARSSSRHASLHSLETAKEHAIRWIQPKRLAPYFELCSKQSLYGTLEYSGNRTTIAIATVAEGRWRFKYTRFTLPQISISHNNKPDVETILEPGFDWSSTLKFSDGQRLFWRPIDQRELQWGFISTSGNPILSISPRPRFLKLEADVHLNPVSSAHPHLPMLVLLGWFLVLLRQR
jgi:hypothetical protein